MARNLRVGEAVTFKQYGTAPQELGYVRRFVARKGGFTRTVVVVDLFGRESYCSRIHVKRIKGPK